MDLVFTGDKVGVGDKGLHIYDTWTFMEDEAKAVKSYYGCFEARAVTKTNAICKFHKKNDKESTSPLNSL